MNWCRKVTDFHKHFASKETKVFIILDLFPGLCPHLYLWTYLQYTEVHQPVKTRKFSKVKQQKDLSINYFNICANIYCETSMEKRRRLSQKWFVNRTASIITAFLNCNNYLDTSSTNNELNLPTVELSSSEFRVKLFSKEHGLMMRIMK